jgi:transketolase
MSEKYSLRKVYGKTLAELGDKYRNIVVLDGDLAKSTKTEIFQKKFPDRFFDIGIAEADLVGTAAGLASCGKIPFVSSFAMFATGKCWEQIRNTIAYSKFNVKIVATHACLSVGEDGASHQNCEDIAIMNVIPNMQIIVPSDDVSTRFFTEEIVSIEGPVYMRLPRNETERIYGEDKQFKFGKAEILRDDGDITIFSMGLMTNIVLKAAYILKKEGIKVNIVDILTVKPIDKETILNFLKKTNKAVVCEEHEINGGLTSIISQLSAQYLPSHIESVSIEDKFGKSGKWNELFNEYGLTENNIIKKVKVLQND